MEREKILKLVIIIVCVIGFIGLILPYGVSIGEYKEYLQKYPDAMNIEEINLTNKDAVNISIIENFKMHSYNMNMYDDEEGTFIFILTIVLIASIVLVLVFTIVNKRVLSIIFGLLLLGSSYLINLDTNLSGSESYTYGISFYLYPGIAAVVIFLSVSSIILSIKNKKK